MKFTKFFFLPIRWTLYIPVLQTTRTYTIGRIAIDMSNLKSRLWLLLRRGKNNETTVQYYCTPRKVFPKAFFDVLYLDRKAHPEWKKAWEVAAGLTTLSSTVRRRSVVQCSPVQSSAAFVVEFPVAVSFVRLLKKVV